MASFSLSQTTAGHIPLTSGARLTDGCIDAVTINNNGTLVFLNGTDNSLTTCGDSSLNARMQRYFGPNVSTEWGTVGWKGLPVKVEDMVGDGNVWKFDYRRTNSSNSNGMSTRSTNSSTRTTSSASTYSSSSVATSSTTAYNSASVVTSSSASQKSSATVSSTVTSTGLYKSGAESLMGGIGVIALNLFALVTL